MAEAQPVYPRWRERGDEHLAALGVYLSYSTPGNASDLQAENNQYFFFQDWVYHKDVFREYSTERIEGVF